MPNSQSQKTHCPHGHPYEGHNLILMVVRDSAGNDTGKRKRQCRICKQGSQKKSDLEKVRPAGGQRRGDHSNAQTGDGG